MRMWQPFTDNTMLADTQEDDMNGKILGCALLIASVVCWAAEAHVVTNAALLRQIGTWRGADAAALKQELDACFAGAAPWRVAVLQGTNGCYEWGVYARVYHGRALLGLRAPVEAYRSLAHAAGFSPLAGLLAAPYAVQTNAVGGLDFLCGCAILYAHAGF